ncbi:GAF domain-containing protein, partial [candidate division WOR-3 bacterium]|nr:GAF domain-containing protein [candidate division WOR-3 bacterium]
MGEKKPFCEEVLRALGEIESLLSLNEDAGLVFEKKEILLEQIRCLSRRASDKLKVNPLRTLSAIKQMNALVILDYSLDELCRKIVEILVNEMGFCNASMLLFNHEKEILELSAAFGGKDFEKPPDFAYNRSLSFKPGSRAAGRAFLEGHTIIIEDVGNDEEADWIQTSIKIETLVSFPVIVESEKIGVINASYESKKEINEQNRFELEVIKGVIGYILLAYTKDRSLKQSSTELIDKIRIQGTYYSQILESLPVAVCELYFDSNEFYISGANPAFYRISGTDKSAANPKLSIYFQEKEAYLKAVNELIMKKKYVFTGAMLRKFDGSELIGDIFLEQSSLEEKNLYSIVIIDKTDEYRLEQRLIQSDKISSLGRLA